MTRCHAIVGAACINLLLGCATPSSVEAPTRIEIASPVGQPNGSSLRIVDVRDAASRIDRTSTSGTPTVYLGDQAFVPAPQEVVARHIAPHLAAQANAGTVQLKRFDVGLMTGTAPRPRHTEWVHGGIVGALLFERLSAALSRGLTSAYAEIVIEVAGKDYSGLDFVNLDAGHDAHQALGHAVTNALRHLVGELSRAQPGPKSGRAP